MRVRLLGVAASGLTEEQQMPMFDGRRRQAPPARDRGDGRGAQEFGSQVDPARRLLDADVAQPSSATRAAAARQARASREE